MVAFLLGHEPFARSTREGEIDDHGRRYAAKGVELIIALTARKLLILESATRAKRAPLPDPV